MSEYLAEHWILGIVASIVLGAIGSGLWEIAFKPIGKKLSSIVFTIITFGAKRAQDNIYKSAAMGHHDLPSLDNLVAMNALLVGVVFLSLFYIYLGMSPPENPIISRKSFMECLERKGEAREECFLRALPENYKNCFEKDGVEQDECIKIAFKEEFMPEFQRMFLVGLFLTVVIFYKIYSVSKVNLIVTYYDQCLKVIRPSIDDGRYHLFQQRYALMSTREDYEKIISEMEHIAKENGISLPASYV